MRTKVENMMSRQKRAFTLIELLVVMAITAVLLTLVAIPLVQGFKLTKTGQAFADAQDKARQIIGRISKEISTAAGVLDNSPLASAVEIRLPLGTPQPGESGNTVTSAVRNPGDPFGSIYLHNAKIDIIPAAKGDPGNPQFNPGRLKIDPTLKAPIGQINLPVAPGQTIVRYWIGQADIERQYLNPYQPTIIGATAGAENLFVLYRAEVSPFILVGGNWVPNTQFFPVDANGQVVINDPGFFVLNPRQPIGALAAHQTRARNWAAVATIISQDLKTDFIIPEVDEATGETVYDLYPPAAGFYIPRVRSLIAFQPVRVNNEPAESNNLLRPGIETVDGETRGAPEYYKTEMLGWTKDSLIRLFTGDPTLNQPYFIGRWRQPLGGGNPLENFNQEIVRFDPTVDTDEFNGGTVIFDLSGYLAAKETNPYPNLGSFIVPNVGPAVPIVLFRSDPRRGRIMMSFSATEAMGLDPSFTTNVVNSNLTGWVTSITGSVPAARQDLGRRFIDLRGLVPAVGTFFNPLGNLAQGWAIDSRIVPGSERVVGPDMRPGPNFGQPIQYARVAQSQAPGLNEYRINYTDIAEPTDYTTFLGIPDPGVNLDVATYIQPRFKKGYIEFNSDPALAFPLNGNFTVTFNFQLNRPTDTMNVDYDSSQQISVEMTLRRYPGERETKAQAVTVKDVVTVRNYLR